MMLTSLNLPRSIFSLTAIGWLLTVVMDAAAVGVTGWQLDTSFGGGTTATLANANTNAPILGNGAANNADNVAIYAPMPLMSLADGQQIILTGSAQFIGSASTGDFRWGLFKDDGVAPAYAGWLGYFGSAEAIVWSKEPTGTNFSTTTFASVAGGRGVELGQASEPNGIPFSAGTYTFKMHVERFGNEALVKVQIANSATGFAIETPFYTESNPARRTFALDRVGILAGSALDADQVRFSGIDVTSSDIVAPTLSVHSNGLVFITNPFNQAYDLTHYEVTSASGGLNKNGWLSLDDQENGDPVGTGWDEIGATSANLLAEVNLVSTSTLAGGGSVRLGSAFTPNAAKDLAFRFTTGGNVLRGPVKYLLSGDYNRSGTVDAADYVLWRKTVGQSIAFGTGADGDGDGVIGPGDYAAWRGNFGLSALVAGQATIVPEPTSSAMLIAWGAACFVRFRGLPRRRMCTVEGWW
jgi:hypothetical protein